MTARSRRHLATGRLGATGRLVALARHNERDRACATSNNNVSIVKEVSHAHQSAVALHVVNGKTTLVIQPSCLALGRCEARSHHEIDEVHALEELRPRNFHTGGVGHDVEESAFVQRGNFFAE